MGRGGRSGAGARDPERKCVATGRLRPRGEMVRFAVGPDGDLAPDLLCRLPGRGIWVSADRAALERAASKNLFSRAAGRQVKVPENLAGLVESLLASRVASLISLARKGGGAVAGYEKVRSMLSREAVGVLVQACDGSRREKSRLRPPPGGGYVGCMTSGELGRAFGRESAVHVALGTGNLAKLVVCEAARLDGVRQADGGKSGIERSGRR